MIHPGCFFRHPVLMGIVRNLRAANQNLVLLP